MSEPEHPFTKKSSFPIRFQPLLCLSIALIIGIKAGEFFSLTLSFWLSISLTITSIALILFYRFLPSFELVKLKWQRKFPLSPGWFTLFVAIGMLRFVSIQPIFTVEDTAYYNDQGKATFNAVIIKPPQVKNHSTTLTVDVKSIHPFYADYERGIQPVSGRMRVTTFNTNDFEYGDELRIICTPETPQSFTDFNYPYYLAARRIYTTCDYAFTEVIGKDQGNWLMKTIFDLRGHAQSTINRMLPPDEAALLSGILLGNEDHIAPEVETAFQRTGTSHIIAISGANFTVLIVLVMKVLLKRLPRRWLLPTAAALICFYTILVGGNAAVVRAAIMGILAVIGSYFGRENRALNTLAFSAALFVLVNPLILWDLGFQLSVGATLGLILFSDREKEILGTWLLKWLPEKWAVRITNWVGEYALMTLSAQIFTLPLIAYTFRHVSLSSFLINIFILPVQPLIMGLGGLAVLIGMLLPFIGQILGWLAWIPLTYTIRVVAWGSNWSWSEIILPRFPLAGLLGFFSLVLVWWAGLSWKPRLRRWINQGGLTLLFGGIVVLIWCAGLQRPATDLQVHLFSLEDSTAVLLQLPDGKAVLLGRSNSIDDLNHTIQQVQSGYQLSIYIQPDSGFRAFNRIENLSAHFPLQDVFINPNIEAETAMQLRSQLEPGTNIHQLTKNQTVQLMDAITLETIAVRDETAAFLLEFGDLRILMPNTVTHSILSQLRPDALQGTTVLILNAGQFNNNELSVWINHPAQTLLVNGEILDCPFCISTAEHQHIHLRSDGVGLWLDGIE